jgi:hypothetical protein
MTAEQSRMAEMVVSKIDAAVNEAMVDGRRVELLEVLCAAPSSTGVSGNLFPGGDHKSGDRVLIVVIGQPVVEMRRALAAVACVEVVK